MDNVTIFLPKGMRVRKRDVLVDVIGRGSVPLSDLDRQSIGRTGMGYPFRSVGKGTLRRHGARRTISLQGIDLRPLNGIDIRLRLCNLKMRKRGSYVLRARYTPGMAWLPEGVRGKAYREHWGIASDVGETALTVCGKEETVPGPPPLQPWRTFPAESFGIVGDGLSDNAPAINEAIRTLASEGGGTIVFGEGDYLTGTVHLRSHVWLRIDGGATLRAISSLDPMEDTWYADNSFLAGSSKTDTTPYDIPDNYLTKQDLGHSFFHNAMFCAVRAEDIRIFGNGRITGDGNIVKNNEVAPSLEAIVRGDKMFSFKLCKDIEIGGLSNGKDLWYDPLRDEPYYLDGDGGAILDTSNMLDVDQGGHFVVLATGVDGIRVHDIRCGRLSRENSRDILDFMECNDVEVRNIYCPATGDDIVKFGSDCALGFTRAGRRAKVRGIIGDSNCNAIQMGSESADDMTDVYIDNVWVTGTNKAAFSISVNDGGSVQRVYMNYGRTGPVHHRTVMERTRSPFFFSISNRGRVLGGKVSRFSFTKEDGIPRDELLVTNVSVGHITDIHIKDVDVRSVYAGSRFRSGQWEPYRDQPTSSAIVTGLRLPTPAEITSGGEYALPDGEHTRYITDISFEGVTISSEGGMSAESTPAPPELAIGEWNLRNLEVQPAHGLWVRHVAGFSMKDCSFSSKRPDSRPPFFCEDTLGKIALMEKLP